MIKYAYDIECFRNLFTVTFVNIDNTFETKKFVIGLGKNDRTALLEFLKTRMTLVGYNNHSYDDPLLRYISEFKGELNPEMIKDISDQLIDRNSMFNAKVRLLRFPRKKHSTWNSIDLMAVLAFDKLQVSLKQVSINLKWHRIQDLPLHHDATVKANELEMVLDYNLNDVLITNRLYEKLTPIRNLRDELSKLYGIDLTSASDSKVANLILENVYSNEFKMNISDIRKERTVRTTVKLNQCLAPWVSFRTPQLQELLSLIKGTIVYKDENYKYSQKIHFAGCKFALGVGGLHSEDKPGKFASDDKYLIQDMDVASYYPNLIINNGFAPRHLGENFITVLKKLTAERIDAKKTYAKLKKQGLEKSPEGVAAETKKEGLKITINSIFGKLGSEYFWLLDAKQMLSTTLSGQMGLLMLIEELYINGIEILSCNTDGVVCKIPVDKQELYYEIAKRWEQATNLELEYTPYKKYVRRDVNSYITEKMDGQTKEKGAFAKKVDLKKSYRMPIVAQALYAYFIKDVPIRQTLEECKDIMEFCISQKVGNAFKTELHTINGVKILQKTNRFFISKTGGGLIKRSSSTGRTTGLYVGRNVTILNDYFPDFPFENYEVDLTFYESEIMKFIDEIEPKQLNLFDLSELGASSKVKLELNIEEKTDELKEEVLTINQLNKLGRNQFSKKIETLIENRETIKEISPRYVYVTEFDERSGIADIYCLRKGVFETVVVYEKSLEKQEMKKGQLVYCTKFKKKEDGDLFLMEYNITNKIEEQSERLL